jgi:hypothetical protein
MKETQPSYLEAHSALNGRLLTSCLLVPAVIEIACLILGVMLDQSWFFVIMGSMLVPIMIGAGLLYRNWPTGIRIDESGISIGAVRSGRAARRRPTVNHQSWGLYTCPWSAVLGMRIVADRDELSQMKDSPQYYTLTNRWSNKAGMRRCNIGVLTSPFMRAALVIEVNPLVISSSEIRRARFYTNFKDGHFSHLVQPQQSPTWVVPTRRAEQLSAALRKISGDRAFVRGQQRLSHRPGHRRPGRAYTGARLQSRMPDLVIHRLIGALVIAAGIRYLWSGLDR